ncbi:hypothetical protein [Chryseobacterium nematophagum]|uniref:hypothetical protein n=1 Tax=Chryseobacterium nematophagum TaxID=2305228 RepID=UPI001604BAA0|nr:hypothetical protein [Chryseobacterium nematophagum]
MTNTHTFQSATPRKKKQSLQVKIISGILASFIVLALATPFISIGILIGWLIWR